MMEYIQIIGASSMLKLGFFVKDSSLWMCGVVDCGSIY